MRMKCPRWSSKRVPMRTRYTRNPSSSLIHSSVRSAAWQNLQKTHYLVKCNFDVLFHCFRRVFSWVLVMFSPKCCCSVPLACQSQGAHMGAAHISNCRDVHPDLETLLLVTQGRYRVQLSFVGSVVQSPHSDKPGRVFASSVSVASCDPALCAHII